MGCWQSRPKSSTAVVDENEYKKLLKQEIENIENRSHGESIEHYIPPTFPLSPLVVPAHVNLINQTWKLLEDGKAEGLQAGTGGRSGIVFFFDEFYLRLFQRSRGFRDYFGSNIKKRGEILLRIINFMTSLDFNRRIDVDKQLYFLGKAHKVKNIRPWMYSVFAEVLIETIMFCLGEDGTYNVSLAWTFVLTYTMQKMLAEAIKGNVLEMEFSANYTTKGAADIDKMSDKSSEVGDTDKGLSTERSRSRQNTSQIL
mmetsp:Transcript_4964/g.7518  ORF Transcript_4964/g.7518 Transcript_4964/m.7518 type:complete len:256 (-) Transcript_4964:141-908(-)